MKRVFPLNSYGYITKWLVSGLSETEIDPATRTIVDQGEYEQFMRNSVHDDTLTEVPGNITIGAPGLAGMPWGFYHAGQNYFVDFAKFYYTVHKCEFWAATVICSDTEQEIPADLRYYTSVDTWLNGEHIFREPICPHSPMRRKRLTFRLRKGENLLFLRAQNSCIRDTRNIVAVSLPDKPRVTVTYPGEETEVLKNLEDASLWLESVSYDGTILKASSAPAYPVSVNRRFDWTEDKFRPDDDLCVAKISVKVGETVLGRTVELSDRIRPPKATDDLSVAEIRRRMIEKYADIPVPAGIGENTNHFYEVYARMALGRPYTADDERVLRVALNEADRNRDCSDFRLCMILKAVWQKLPFPAESLEEIRKTALGFSYWTDEKAVGAMCYNSENHALLFHACQLIAGMLWQDEIFVRSGRTGREQEAVARRRIDGWLAKREKDGFAEFLSGGYTVVTVTALLAVYDCAGGEYSVRAGKLLDKIFYDLAANSFGGVIYAPMGRIYRSVLTPWTNSTEALLYFAIGKGTPQSSDWLTAFAHTDYVIPDDIGSRMTEPGMTSYFSAGTKIQTYKSDGYMLTSLAVPVVGEGAPGPFIPGKLGYQQHLLYAAYGDERLVFTSHPGGSHDDTTIRPGYWYGNGYFPYVVQWDNVLGQVFRLNEDHPIPFVHLYFPGFAFDEVVREDGWIFARYREAYLGIYCSGELKLYNGDTVQNADYRVTAPAVGFLFVCGDRKNADNFDSFRNYAKSFRPSFSQETATLTLADGRTVGGKFTEAAVFHA